MKMDLRTPKSEKYPISGYLDNCFHGDKKRSHSSNIPYMHGPAHMGTVRDLTGLDWDPGTQFTNAHVKDWGGVCFNYRWAWSLGQKGFILSVCKPFDHRATARSRC